MLNEDEIGQIKDLIRKEFERERQIQYWQGVIFNCNEHIATNIINDHGDGYVISLNSFWENRAKEASDKIKELG